MNVLVVGNSSRRNNEVEFAVTQIIPKLARKLDAGEHRLIFSEDPNSWARKIYEEMKCKENCTLCSTDRKLNCQELDLPRENFNARSFKSLAQRDEFLYENSEVILALPNSVDALSVVLKGIERQLQGEEGKKILIYNLSGCFDKVLEAVDETVYEGYTQVMSTLFYSIAYNEAELMYILSRFEKELSE